MSSSKTKTAQSKKQNNDIDEDARKQLPKKEHDLFTKALIDYENRKFKDAIESLQKILRKYPNHGETLAMKGLIWRHYEQPLKETVEERKRRALELCALGVKNNVFSHVCWHVFGLLHKANRDYKEAAKCFHQALRIDPYNHLVWRDVSQCALVRREWDEFVDARVKLYELKAGDQGAADRCNQISIGLFMQGKFVECLEMIKESERVEELEMRRRNGEQLAKTGKVKEKFFEEKFLESEMILFKALVLEKCELNEDAIELLEQKKDLIVDDSARLTKLCVGKILVGDLAGARHIAENSLVNRMPDNEKFHELLHKSIGFKESISLMDKPREREEKDVKTLLSLYETLQAKYPTSSVCKRYPLQIVNDSAHFEKLLAEYIQKPLRKGVPSLFADISSLYGGIHDDEKSIGKVLNECVESLKQTQKFPPIMNSSSSRSSTSTSKEEEREKKPKETLRYALNLYAMHFSKIGKYDVALKYIDEAINLKDDGINDDKKEGDEAILEFHLNKSRILRRCGDLEGAFRESEIARELDLADRYINSISVKRAFQCGKYREAERLATLFTRDSERHETNLFDMQCNWYAFEAGFAHEKFEKNFGRALKYFSEIKTHCDQVVEDQIDFHRYCVNIKRTIRAFIDTMRMCDDIYATAWYKKASRRAILILCDLHDDPVEKKKERAEQTLSSLADAEERKKERQKMRKDEERKEKEMMDFEKTLASEIKLAKENKVKRTGKSSSAASLNNNNDKTDKDAEKREIEIKHGLHHMNSIQNPLDEALTFLNPLLSSKKNDDDLNVQSLAFLVHFKREKWILCSKALRKMARINAHSPLTKRCLNSLENVVVNKIDEKRSTDDDSAAIAIEKEVVMETIESLKKECSNDNNGDDEKCVKSIVDFAHRAISKNAYDTNALTTLKDCKKWKKCREALEVFERSGKYDLFDAFQKDCLKLFPKSSAGVFPERVASFVVVRSEPFL